MRSKKAFGLRARVAAAAILALATPGLSACSMFGGDSELTLTNMPANLAVNPFMWQATLDTLHFMPIASADPAAGRIRTGWSSVAGNPAEEVMVDVLIVGKELRADTIGVDVYRRVNGAPAGVNAKTAAEVQAAIILRARQLVNSAEEY